MEPTGRGKKSRLLRAGPRHNIFKVSIFSKTGKCTLAMGYFTVKKTTKKNQLCEKPLGYLHTGVSGTCQIYLILRQLRKISANYLQNQLA